ncbi:uncharacterized protein, partial [Castor canadensis]|uniref:Uncharacterized protein n=1 Tax=Castor canadensis TaxID=51338 RepID=A0AC58LE16_CASCN
ESEAGWEEQVHEEEVREGQAEGGWEQVREKQVRGDRVQKEQVREVVQGAKEKEDQEEGKQVSGLFVDDDLWKAVDIDDDEDQDDLAQPRLRLVSVVSPSVSSLLACSQTSSQSSQTWSPTWSEPRSPSESPGSSTCSHKSTRAVGGTCHQPGAVVTGLGLGRAGTSFLMRDTGGPCVKANRAWAAWAGGGCKGVSCEPVLPKANDKRPSSVLQVLGSFLLPRSLLYKAWPSCHCLTVLADQVS